MQRNVFAGSEFLLYDIDNNPIALSKNSALKVNQKLSDVTTKNSLGWTELMPTIKDWSIEFEGLVSYGSGFTFSYFYQKYQDKEPFFIRFGIIQDDFEHTFYGEVVIESINQSASMDDVATFDGSLKGIGNLSFTNEGTPEQNGYLKVETDPVFRGSPAFGITNDIKNKWNESYDKTLTEVEFVQSGNTTTLKTHLRDGSIYSSSFINIGGSGSSINNLSFNTGNGTLTVGSLTTSLDGRYQTIGDYVGLSYLQNNYYTKLQSDNSFYPLNNPDGFITADYNGFSLTSHTHSYSEITDKPTNLSFFTNDLGNYGGFLTSESDTLDSVVQRGATTNQNVSFTGSLVIPQSESSIEGAIWISDTLNSTGYTPSIVANLNDLSDVNISSASSGQALVYNGFGTWTNQSVVTDLSNYYTKSQADTKYSLTSHTHSYSEITGKPTLFSGAYSDLSGKPNNLSEFTNDLNNYGNWITKAQGDTYYPAITGYNKSNWDTAYGWGNHASAGYALANGSNASGTWGINISGNAGSATKWANEIYSTSAPANSDYLMVNDGTAWKAQTKGAFATALGLNDGSTLINNISGNAQSATNWGGTPADFSNTPTNMASFIGYDNTQAKMMSFSSTQAKSFLGIPSGGETLQSVTDRGNSTTNGIIVPYVNFPVKTGTNSFGIGNDATGGFFIYDNTAGVYRLNILNNGNVGIGYTTDQGYKLSVNGRGFFSDQLTVRSDDSNTRKLALSTYNPAGGNMTAIYMGYASDGNDPYGVRIVQTGNPTSSKNGGFLFQSHNGVTGAGDASYYNLMSLDPSGNAIFANNVNASSFYANNWFRSTGANGWYNETYGGGIYMEDSSWVRVYAEKGFLVGGTVGIQSPRFMNTTDGFKTYNYRGMVGDYDQNSSTEKIIWTIGDNWNTLATMYGLGYTYNAIDGFGHSLFMALNGTKTVQFSLETGSASFNGTITAPKASFSTELIIPTVPSSTVGAIWLA